MIYIWIRLTLDWTDEAAFRSQLHADIIDQVELWNRTFKVPYHLFRQRLKEIARTNLARVEGTVCAEWENIPDGSLVIPVDDDDWFAPELGRKLAEALNSNHAAYYWPAHFLQIPIHLRHQIGLFRRYLFPSVPRRHLCITNNYAMLKTPDNKVLLEKHLQATRWFESHLETEVREISDSLSIMNRSLGSLTSLREIRPPFARDKLLLRYRRYQHLYDGEMSPGLNWSHPYREMMAALMQELT